MNEAVRTYLINAARKKGDFVHYSVLVKECNLGIDLSTDYGQKQLSTILGEVSEFEHRQNRPLISSMAIYKDPNKNDHGDGFYKVAEYLGIGKFKQLKEEAFGFTEAQKCREFWQKEENYQKYAGLENKPLGLVELFERFLGKDDSYIGHWKKGYLEFVRDIQKLRESFLLHPHLPIDDPSHYSQLSPSIQSYEGFMEKWLKSKDNLISARGQSVLSQSNYHKIVGDVTFKIIAREAIANPTIGAYNTLWHWWRNNESINNRPLLINRAFAACNPETLSSTVHDPKFRQVADIFSKSFGFKHIVEHQYNWYLSNEQLTAWLDIELETALKRKTSDRLEQIILRNIFVWLIYEKFSPTKGLPPNQLIQRSKPQNGVESIPERENNFRGVDVDFQAKARRDKDLGDAGEDLVMKMEVEFLEKKGLHEKAKMVNLVKDGEGYDVLSFDANGNEKYIEVKTTSGHENTPFYMSANEVEFMRLHPGEYYLYRVYHYDEEFNSGEYYILDGDVENQLLMKPLQFQVFLKKDPKP